MCSSWNKINFVCFFGWSHMKLYPWGVELVFREGLLFLLSSFLYLNFCLWIFLWFKITKYLDFPGGSSGKEPACSTERLGLIPGLGRSLEKEMPTCSNILAWRILWIEKPGELQSMGSQRVGQAEWLSLSLMKYLVCWASYLPFLPPNVLTSFLQLLWCRICAAFQWAQYAEFQNLCFPGGLAQWKYQEQTRQEEEGEVGAHSHWLPHSLLPHTPTLTILCLFVFLWRKQPPAEPWHIETLTSLSWSFRPRGRSGCKDASLGTIFHCCLLHIVPTPLWLSLSIIYFYPGSWPKQNPQNKPQTKAIKCSGNYAIQIDPVAVL